MQTSKCFIDIMKKHKKIVWISFAIALCAVYLFPRPVKDILQISDSRLMDTVYASYIYSTFFPSVKIFKGNLEIADQALFDQLLNDVSLSGPVLAKRGMLSSGIEGLLDVAIKDGEEYRHVTVTIFAENEYSYFLNIANNFHFNRGYFVLSGKNVLSDILEHMEDNGTAPGRQEAGSSLRTPDPL